MPIMEPKTISMYVCACLFSDKNRFFSKVAILKCPHCAKTLDKIKEREDFHIFKIMPVLTIQRKLNALSSKEKKQF